MLFNSNTYVYEGPCGATMDLIIFVIIVQKTNQGVPNCVLGNYTKSFVKQIINPNDG